MKRRILVLYWDSWHRPLRLAVQQHLMALPKYHPEHRYYFHNAKFKLPGFLFRQRHDAIFLHNTFLCLRWNENRGHWNELAEQVAALDGLKLAIPQDEYDHSGKLDDFLDRVGTQGVFSCFESRFHSLLYPKLVQKAAFHQVLTGYIDDSWGKLPFPKEKKWDVVYRASRLPFWFGRQGQLKFEIGIRAQEAVARLGLRADISCEPDAVFAGKSWLDFLASGKAVVGCEGGSSLVDRYGLIQNRIREYLQEHPGAGFDEVEAQCFPGLDGKYPLYALSPRHLESAATGTVQILVEGTYSGVLTPGEHYIPVRRDLTNLDQALAQVRDASFCQKMVERSYRDIVASEHYTYQRFADLLLEAIPAPSLAVVELPGVVMRYRAYLLALAVRKAILAPFYALAVRLLRRPDSLPGRWTLGLYRKFKRLTDGEAFSTEEARIHGNQVTD